VLVLVGAVELLTGDRFRRLREARLSPSG
jgi:hypothetical protein